MKKNILIVLLLMGLGVNLNADITILKGAKEACDAGVASGCFSLGLMYYSGQGVKQDSHKAKELFGKACDDGHAGGCEGYAILNKR